MTPDPHPLDQPEGEPPATGDATEDPVVDPSDAGFPSSPDLDDDNTVVTEPGADPEPGAAAG